MGAIVWPQRHAGLIQGKEEPQVKHTARQRRSPDGTIAESSSIPSGAQLADTGQGDSRRIGRRSDAGIDFTLLGSDSWIGLQKIRDGPAMNH